MFIRVIRVIRVISLVSLVSLISMCIGIGPSIYAKESKRQNESKKVLYPEKSNVTVQKANKNENPSKNIIVVKIDGLVCSFCAYGAEKKLSKLPFISKEKYGKDGVLVDIETGITKLAINPEKKVDLNQIIKAIVKGGYSPKKLIFRVYGTMTKKKNDIIVIDSRYPYQFHISQKESIKESIKESKNKSQKKIKKKSKEKIKEEQLSYKELKARHEREGLVIKYDIGKNIKEHYFTQDVNVTLAD